MNLIRVHTFLVNVLGERMKGIEEKLRTLKDNWFKEDKFVKHFQLSIADAMTRVTGRVLDPPKLSYTSGMSTPKDGKWNMGP